MAPAPPAQPHRPEQAWEDSHGGRLYIAQHYQHTPEPGLFFHISHQTAVTGRGIALRREQITDVHNFLSKWLEGRP